MRVARGVVCMFKRIGQRTEPLDTPREREEGGDIKLEARTEKVRDDK